MRLVYQELIDLLMIGLKEINPNIPVEINNNGEDVLKKLVKNATSGSFVTILSDTIDNAIHRVTYYLDKELDKK